VFAFSPDILLSPLAPPHSIIDPIVDKALAYCYNKAAGRKLQPLIDVLTNLKNRPDFSTQWPDTYIQEAKKGKLHLEKLEAVRKDKYCMKDILALEPTLLEWWNNV
jgi:hypothetical protein